MLTILLSWIWIYIKKAAGSGPHWEEQLDPDPHKMNADPQPCPVSTGIPSASSESDHTNKQEHMKRETKISLTIQLLVWVAFPSARGAVEGSLPMPTHPTNGSQLSDPACRCSQRTDPAYRGQGWRRSYPPRLWFGPHTGAGYKEKMGVI